MNPYIKSKYNKLINKKQNGGYDGTEVLPVKASFDDKMKYQQQYGNPQTLQGELPTNIENRTRNRNLRGDDIYSSVDEDIASKYAVMPDKEIKIDASTVRGEDKSSTARNAFEKSANERFNKNNPISGYKGLTTKQSEINYENEMFKGKNTKNSDGSETTPLTVTNSTRTIVPPTDISKTSSTIELGGDKKGDILTPRSENGKSGNMNVQLDFQERGHGDENGKITEKFYSKLDPKTANILRKAGGNSQLITSNEAVSDPELQNAINKAIAVHGEERSKSTALKSSLDSSAMRNETMRYLQQNNPMFNELSKGEQSRLFQKGNEDELNKRFGQSIIEFNNNRVKYGTEVNRRSSFTAQGDIEDKDMSKTKTIESKAPSIEATINTSQGDRLKLKGENPPYSKNTPPNKTTNPQPKPKTGTGKYMNTNRTSTSTSKTNNPGKNSSNPGRSRDIKMATKNESSAPATKIGTLSVHDMKVKGKGDVIESKTKKFVPSKQMGGYSNQYDSDYGQYTQSNTPINPKLGSIDYYKQVMQSGGRISRFNQLDNEMNKVNQDKPKYQTGQRIKYKMGGNIKEGVVKSYDKSNGNITLY